MINKIECLNFTHLIALYISLVFPLLSLQKLCKCEVLILLFIPKIKLL